MKLISKFELYTADNGYILKGHDAEESENGEMTLVCSEDSSEDEDIENVANFLRALASRMAPSGSRYAPKRLYVQIAPGDNTPGLSIDEEYQLQALIQEKKEDESWEAYGKRIHEEMTDRLTKSREYKLNNGYDE